MLKIVFDSNTKKLLFRITMASIVMRLIYDYIYKSQLATIYRYSGFVNDLSLIRSIITWGILFSFIPFVVRFLKEPKFSNTVCYILFFIHIIPGTIMMAYMKVDYLALWYCYFLILYFGVFLCSKRHYVNRSHHYLTKRGIYTIVGMFSVIVIFIWLYYAHGRINLGLDDVYSIRLAAREYGMPMALRYIYASMKTVLPILIVWALYNNNKFLAAAFAIVQLIIFFTDGTKSTLFALIASIGGYYFLKDNSRMKYVPELFSLIGIGAIAEYKLAKTFYITGIFIRRIMFVPHRLNIRYFEFFTEHHPDYFAASLPGFKSDYGSIARTIGRVYSGSNDLAANNGLFSDAYANLGIAGVFIMPIVIVLLLNIIDRYSSELNINAMIGSIVAFVPSVISASFFTLFLTHGVVAMILIYYLIPKEKRLASNSS